MSGFMHKFKLFFGWCYVLTLNEESEKSDGRTHDEVKVTSFISRFHRIYWILCIFTVDVTLVSIHGMFVLLCCNKTHEISLQCPWVHYVTSSIALFLSLCVCVFLCTHVCVCVYVGRNHARSCWRRSCAKWRAKVAAVRQAYPCLLLRVLRTICCCLSYCASRVSFDVFFTCRKYGFFGVREKSTCGDDRWGISGRMSLRNNPLQWWALPKDVTCDH